MRKHVEHRLGVLGEALVRAHATGRARARGVGVPGHERGDRRGPGSTGVGVIGQARGHEQRPDVGVPESELTKLARVLADLLRRVVRRAHEDLLGGEHHFDGRLEGVDVEAGRLRRRNFIRLMLARLQAELSMCMYSEHGFDPLMRSVLDDVCHC